LSSSTTEPSVGAPSAEDEGPTVEVTMPETGSESGTTLVGWLVEPGQPVELDEPICLVSWNETTAEVGSPATGVLRMLSVGTGVTVPTGTSLALIDTRLTPRPHDQVRDPGPSESASDPSAEEDGANVRQIRNKSPEAADDDSADAPAEDVEAPPDVSSPTQPVPQQLLRDAPVESTEAPGLGSFHSPAVRRLAADLAIDLDDIAGTGLDGRVTLRDVRDHASLAAKSSTRA
jgi:pyruvate dehydrogenase E2 component (dihydrolipoamide acetyltransferase)